MVFGGFRDDVAEHRQIGFDNYPYAVNFDTEIVMDQNVTQAGECNNAESSCCNAI